MKRMMVKRCEATYVINEGLYAAIHGLSMPRWPEIDRERLLIRCEDPLGHRESGHRGSEHDLGRNGFSWGGRSPFR